MEVLGDPQLVDTSTGKAVSFDGDGDRLLIEHNPLGSTTAFTIEVVFKPNDAYPENIEPRFLHIEDPADRMRRITKELLLNENHEWYFDTFIKSDTGNSTTQMIIHTAACCVTSASSS